jgi:pimeloyl-ACP methyl ester carboxylesterase
MCLQALWIACAAWAAVSMVSMSQAQAQAVPEAWPSPGKPAPSPDADLFYRQPDAAVLATMLPGTVLRYREVSTTAYFVFPMGGQAWQLMYRSTNTKGQAVANVTTVMVPSNAPPAGRVLLSYQTAYDGLSLRCAPSHELLHGSAAEAGLIAPALLKGWVVVAPDYEGPQAQWTAGRNAGQGVLDSIRAVENFEPAGLSGPQTPTVMMGYSGGALASTWAAELHPGYAPELNLRGAAVGGVPVDMGNTARKIDGGLFVGIYFGAVAGLARAYPEVDPNALFNDKGLRMLANVGQMCVGQFLSGTMDPLAAYFFQRMSSYTKVPQLLDVPIIKRIIADNRLGQRPPTIPMYIYEGTADELIPVKDVDNLVQTYCRAGVRVQYKRVFNEHVVLAVTGYPAALSYLSDRLAGRPAPSSCY